MKWVTVKFLWIKLLCTSTLGCYYTEGTFLHCDYFHLGISCIVFVLICTVVTLYCFVMCGCVCVWVFVCSFVMCGCVCVGFVMCGCVHVWVCECV